MSPEESHLVSSVNLRKWLVRREIQGLIIAVKKALAGSF